MHEEATLAMFAKLRQAAGLPLDAWLARREALVLKATTRAELASHVLDKVLKDWAEAQRAPTFKTRIVLAGGPFTPTRIEAALPTLRTAGFVAAVSPDGYRRDVVHLAGSVAPEVLERAQAEEARLLEREVQALASAGPETLPVGLGAPHPDALTQKHATWSPVAGETWVFPATETRIKQRGGDKVTYEPGRLAYRLAKGTRLPTHYAKRVPPAWAKGLVTHPPAWAPFHDFTFGPKALSALQTAGSAAGDINSRYGVTGVTWDQDWFVATDGNRMHGVVVPEPSPPELRAVQWEQWNWGQPTWGARKNHAIGDGGYNATASTVCSTDPFPDVRQVMPGAFTAKVFLDIAYMRTLETAVKDVGRTSEMLELHALPDGWRLRWRDADRRYQQIELPPPDGGRNPVEQHLAVDARLFLKALAPFKRQGLVTCFMPSKSYFSPILLEQFAGNPQRLLQFAIIMPIRTD